MGIQNEDLNLGRATLGPRSGRCAVHARRLWLGQTLWMVGIQRMDVHFKAWLRPGCSTSRLPPVLTMPPLQLHAQS